MNKKIVILAAISLFVVVIITNILINMFLWQDSDKSKQKIHPKKTSSIQKPFVVSSKRKGKLVVSDPAKYGIVITSKANEPRTQMGWDIYVDKIVKSSGVLEEEKLQSKFEEISSSTEEFQNKLDILDKRIDEHKTRKENNPSDEAANKNLQDLYQLKALMKSMKKKVIKSSTDVLPLPNTK